MSCHKLICKRPKTTCHDELSHEQTFSITLFEGLKRSMVVRCQNLAIDGSKLKENKLDFHEKFIPRYGESSEKAYIHKANGSIPKI